MPKSDVWLIMNHLHKSVSEQSEFNRNDAITHTHTQSSEENNELTKKGALSFVCRFIMTILYIAKIHGGIFFRFVCAFGRFSLNYNLVSLLPLAAAPTEYKVSKTSKNNTKHIDFKQVISNDAGWAISNCFRQPQTAFWEKKLWY